MENDDSIPETKPAGRGPPPRPPHHTAIGLGPDGDDSDNKPKITVTRAAKGEGKFIRKSGDIGQHGHVIITLAPNGRGEGNVIHNDSPVGAIPEKYIEAVIDGIHEALDEGVYDSRPIVDVLVHIINGSWDEIASNELAFRMAAIFAIKDAIIKTEPIGVD